MYIFLIIITVIAFLLFIDEQLSDDKRDAYKYFLVFAILFYVLLMVHYRSSYHEKTITIPNDKITVLFDEDIAIIKRKGFKRTFEKRYEIEAIKRGDFELKYVKKFNRNNWCYSVNYEFNFK